MYFIFGSSIRNNTHILRVSALEVLGDYDGRLVNGCLFGTSQVSQYQKVNVRFFHSKLISH